MAEHSLEDDIILIIPSDIKKPATFNIPEITPPSEDIFSKIAAAQQATAPAFLGLTESELEFLISNIDYIKFRPIILTNIPDVELSTRWLHMQHILETADFETLADFLAAEGHKTESQEAEPEVGDKPDIKESRDTPDDTFEPLET
jgi:hypothetical protein